MAQPRDSLDSLDSADLDAAHDDDLDDDIDARVSNTLRSEFKHDGNSDQEDSMEYNARDSLDSYDNDKARKGDSPPRSRYDENEESSEEEDDLSMSRGNATSLNFDYSTLKVSSELKELFSFIDRYKPIEMELETRLKPFVPDYIPAVGDIDPFVKIERPDGKQDHLGLKLLDEPSIDQSDSAALELQILQTNKVTNTGPLKVRGIENVEKNSKTITGWIKKINELHAKKPQSTVTYSKNMPDFDSLMSEWPSDFEKLLESTKLPSADLDVTTETYTRIICAILDIPVHGKITESLHVLFNLYSAFKESQHFGQANNSNPTENNNVANSLTMSKDFANFQ